MHGCLVTCVNSKSLVCLQIVRWFKFCHGPHKQTRLLSIYECWGSPFEQNAMAPWHQQFHLTHFLLVFPKTPIPTPNNHGSLRIHFLSIFFQQKDEGVCLIIQKSCRLFRELFFSIGPQSISHQLQKGPHSTSPTLVHPTLLLPVTITWHACTVLFGHVDI